jgi:hypothetical protein
MSIEQLNILERCATEDIRQVSVYIVPKIAEKSKVRLPSTLGNLNYHTSMNEYTAVNSCRNTSLHRGMNALGVGFSLRLLAKAAWISNGFIEAKGKYWVRLTAQERCPSV